MGKMLLQQYECIQDGFLVNVTEERLHKHTFFCRSHMKPGQSPLLTTIVADDLFSVTLITSKHRVNDLRIHVNFRHATYYSLLYFHNNILNDECFAYKMFHKYHRLYSIGW